MTLTGPDRERTAFERWIAIQTEVLMPLGRRGERDALIGAADELLAGERDQSFRQLVIMGVAAILQAHGWENEGLVWARRAVAEAPDDPLAHNGLAMWYFVNAAPDWKPDDLAAALEHSATAVATARAKGAWRCSVLYDRCRIAAAARRWDIVAEAMAEILAVRDEPCDPDSPTIESDWLDAMPADAIDADLLRRYRAAAGSG